MVEFLFFFIVFIVLFLAILYWKKQPSDEDKSDPNKYWQPDLDEQKAKLVETNHDTLNGQDWHQR